MAAICVGVLVAYNDPTLVSVFLADDITGTAAATPFVIAMQNMKIEALPHIVNALLLTMIFSAGNCYMYCASRSLYGFALDGRAPSVLQKCTKKGVPIYCVFVAMCFLLLSLLSISNGSSEALTWLTSLITAGALINYIVICITYLAFYRACKVQNLDRRSFPYSKDKAHSKCVSESCQSMPLNANEFNRCIACRHSKIKCSGDDPCINCQRRDIRCEFTEGTSRVVVPDRLVYSHSRGTCIGY
ncbi:AAT family amino acid transporter [Penicillium malachiteum]|uniref:AAT family amino acid transporter n=1 Tax=Penicillium malachiteum TaxID=1324776 RepID=A0AAD6HA81_9EURO|nr:AAT family amino acid transporter [Penicillium malachiteum]